ncbi:MAG: TerB family tellurite resistance protein [Nitrosomonadales bacterium]|nr:TerB family tellurite resistance protein [Nitrosomonadales bacterium]
MLNKLNTFLSTLIAPASVGSRPEHTLQLATAVLLIEVMKSDAEMEVREQAAVLEILKARFDLSDAEVMQLTELGHQTASAANDFHQFTSLINRELEPSEKIRIIEYMWQVAYADGKISAHENHLMRKISDLLYLPHRDYIAAKMRAKPAERD